MTQSFSDKGRLHEAEKALCWLRGWVTPEHVKSEFCDLCQSIERPVSVTTINSIILETNAAKEQPPKKSWHSYLERTFYLPFALVTWAFFINAFGGIMTLQVFAVVILDELKTPIDKWEFFFFKFMHDTFLFMSEIKLSLLFQY